MGVLEQMRSGSDSTFMQVVLALVVVAFVGLYVRPQGQRSGVVAVVNGVRIMDTEQTRLYRDWMARVEGQQNRTLSQDERDQLYQQVRQELVDREVMNQEAREMSLAISDDEVARRIVVDDPRFKGADGKFSRKGYEIYLKRSQFTEEAYQERVRAELLREKVLTLAYLGASLSEPALRERYIEGETRVRLDIVEIRASAFESEVSITDEERQAWAASNGSQIEEAYDRDFERLYNHPEQVRLRMIRLAENADGPKAADLRPILVGLREQVEGGADFAELARKWSEDPSALRGGDQGLKPVLQLSTQEAQAVEDAAEGSMVVFSTDTDVRLVRVEQRVLAEIDELDAVRDQIADQLIRAERVPALAAAFAEDQLRPAWSEAGVPPEDILTSKGLRVTSSGMIPTQRGPNPFAPPQILLDAARAADTGAVLPQVYEDAGVLYVAQLQERQDPDMEAFESSKERLREQFLYQERSAFFDGWLTDLKARSSIE